MTVEHTPSNVRTALSDASGSKVRPTRKNANKGGPREGVPGAPAPQLVFIGRREESGMFHRFLLRDSGCYLLTGPEGIGKSAFLDNIMANTRNMRDLRYYCGLYRPMGIEPLPEALIKILTEMIVGIVRASDRPSRDLAIMQGAVMKVPKGKGALARTIIRGVWSDISSSDRFKPFVDMLGFLNLPTSQPAVADTDPGPDAMKTGKPTAGKDAAPDEKRSYSEFHEYFPDKADESLVVYKHILDNLCGAFWKVKHRLVLLIDNAELMLPITLETMMTIVSQLPRGMFILFSYNSDRPFWSIKDKAMEEYFDAVKIRVRGYGTRLKHITLPRFSTSEIVELGRAHAVELDKPTAKALRKMFAGKPIFINALLSLPQKARGPYIDTLQRKQARDPGSSGSLDSSVTRDVSNDPTRASNAKNTVAQIRQKIILEYIATQTGGTKTEAFKFAAAVSIMKYPLDAGVYRRFFGIKNVCVIMEYLVDVGLFICDGVWFWNDLY